MDTQKVVRKNKGRQKIEIRPIQSKSNRHVTFCKRRNGLLNKACELSILCGCDVGIISFSPGNKPFAFGNPSVHAVFNRFLALKSYEQSVAQASHCAAASPNFDAVKERDLNTEYGNSLGFVGALERKKRSESPVYDTLNGFWWDQPTDAMSLCELEEHKRSLIDLKSIVLSKIDSLEK